MAPLNLVKLNQKVKKSLLERGLIITLSKEQDNRFIKKIIRAFELVSPESVFAKLTRYVNHLPMLSKVFDRIAPEGVTILHNILISGYLGKYISNDISIITSLDIQSRWAIGNWQFSLNWSKNELGDPNVKDPAMIRLAISVMKFNYIVQATLRYVPNLRGHLIGHVGYNFLS